MAGWSWHNLLLATATFVHHWTMLHRKSLQAENWLMSSETRLIIPQLQTYYYLLNSPPMARRFRTMKPFLKQIRTHPSKTHSPIHYNLDDSFFSLKRDSTMRVTSASLLQMFIDLFDWITAPFRDTYMIIQTDDCRQGSSSKLCASQVHTPGMNSLISVILRHLSNERIIRLKTGLSVLQKTTSCSDKTSFFHCWSTFHSLALCHMASCRWVDTTIKEPTLRIKPTKEVKSIPDCTSTRKNRGIVRPLNVSRSNVTNFSAPSSEIVVSFRDFLDPHLAPSSQIGLVREYPDQSSNKRYADVSVRFLTPDPPRAMRARILSGRSNSFPSGEIKKRCIVFTKPVR